MGHGAVRLVWGVLGVHRMGEVGDDNQIASFRERCGYQHTVAQIHSESMSIQTLDDDARKK